MISTTSSALLAAGVVTLGRWGEGKPLTVRVVIGTTGIVLFLAVMGEVNADLASKIGLIVLISALLIYFPSIVSKLGLK